MAVRKATAVKMQPYSQLVVLMTACLAFGAEAILPLAPEEQRPLHPIAVNERDDVAAILREIDSRWPQRRIDPRSKDYATMLHLRAHPELARKAIEELINLADLLEPVPYAMSTRRRKLDLSPAGKILVALGEDADLEIGRWLHLHFEEASNRREVLLECMNDIKVRRLAKIETARREQETHNKREEQKLWEEINSTRAPVIISREDPFAGAPALGVQSSWLIFAAGAASSAALLLLIALVRKWVRGRWRRSMFDASNHPKRE
jgi:hypothetical protein